MRFFYSTFIFLFLTAWLSYFYIFADDVSAERLTQAMDIRSRVRAGEGANHELRFSMASSVGLPGSPQTISVYFFQSVGNMAHIQSSDVNLLYGSLNRELEYAVGDQPGTNVWGFSRDDTRKSITLTFPNANGIPITTGQRVIIKIGANTRNGTRQLVNGNIGNNQLVEITTGVDTAHIAVALIPNDSVGVSGSVEQPPPPTTVAIVTTQTTTQTTTPTETTTQETPPQETTTQPSTTETRKIEAPKASETTTVQKASEKPAAETSKPTIRTETPKAETREQPTVGTETPKIAAPSLEATGAANAPSEVVTTPSGVLITPAQGSALPPKAPLTEPIIAQLPATASTAPPAIVSLGTPVLITASTTRDATASIVNTNATTGNTTAVFAEVEKNTLTQDGKLIVEPIPLDQAKNVDEEIRIPSGKDIPDSVLYKINVSAPVTRPIRITMKYDPALLGGIDEDSLKVNQWDPKELKWIPIENSRVDKKNHLVGADVIPKSIYTLLGTIVSQEKHQQKQRVIAKNAPNILPRNSGLLQTDFKVSNVLDQQPLRFANYDFYVNGATPVTLCLEKKLFVKEVGSIILSLGKKRQAMVFEKERECWKGEVVAPVDQGTYPLKIKVLYTDDYSEIVYVNLAVTSTFDGRVKPLLRPLIDQIQGSPLSIAFIWGSIALVLVSLWVAIDSRVRRWRKLDSLLAHSQK